MLVQCGTKNFCSLIVVKDSFSPVEDQRNCPRTETHFNTEDYVTEELVKTPLTLVTLDETLYITYTGLKQKNHYKYNPMTS